MTALVGRKMPEASPGSVDRAMRALDLQGIRRSKGIRTTIPSKDGTRAGDLLDRDFTAAAPNRTWVMDFTYVRCWAGWVYVAFIVDVFAQRIVAWNAATAKDVDLVMTPIRMATWQRAREGHPVVPGQLIGHADAGSQYTAIRFTEHLDLEGIRPSIGSVACHENGTALSGLLPFSWDHLDCQLLDHPARLAGDRLDGPLDRRVRVVGAEVRRRGISGGQRG